MRDTHLMTESYQNAISLQQKNLSVRQEEEEEEGEGEEEEKKHLNSQVNHDLIRCPANSELFSNDFWLHFATRMGNCPVVGIQYLFIR